MLLRTCFRRPPAGQSWGPPFTRGRTPGADPSNPGGISLPQCLRVQAPAIRGGHSAPKMTPGERLKNSMVRPDDDPKEEEKTKEIRPVEEIEADINRSNDKERAIGLGGGPGGCPHRV